MNATICAHHCDSSPSESISCDNVCVLFLDFDGVTHPEPCRADQAFSQLPLIEAVLRQHPKVEVVISSSWRLVHSLDAMRAHFALDIAPRVIGITPSNNQPSSDWLPSASSSIEREGECDTWMKQNRPWGTPWVAIDDRAHWFRPGCSDLLLTNAKTGFTSEDGVALHAMFQERM